MDDRSNKETDVEIVNEAPAEDVAELDDVKLAENDTPTEEVATLNEKAMMSNNDSDLNDAALEHEAAAEEIAELDEIDTLDSQPEPTDVPVLRRDPTDTPGDGGAPSVLRRDPPDTPTDPDFLLPPPEAKVVFPAVIDDKRTEPSVTELEVKPSIIEQPDNNQGIETLG